MPPLSSGLTMPTAIEADNSKASGIKPVRHVLVTLNMLSQPMRKADHRFRLSRLPFTTMNINAIGCFPGKSSFMHFYSFGAGVD
jgi:hypothetical protein